MTLFGGSRPAAPRSIDQHEVDETTLHIRGHQLDAYPLTQFGLGRSRHELSFDRGREEANPGVTHRVPRHDGIELLPDVRFEELRCLRFADAALDPLCGIFLRGAVLCECLQLGDAVRRLAPGEQRLEHARRDQVGESAVRRGGVRVIAHRQAKVTERRAAGMLHDVLA